MQDSIHEILGAKVKRTKRQIGGWQSRYPDLVSRLNFWKNACFMYIRGKISNSHLVYKVSGKY